VTRRQATGPRPPLSVRALFALTVAIALLLANPPVAQSPTPAPIRGLSQGLALASAYDAILDADFESAPARLTDACESVPEWCMVMRAVSLWWQIALDPEDRTFDAAFERAAQAAIRAAEAWTKRAPLRAEAWFAQGAAYGARAQWRVARRERLAAARDGKHIKAALERALELDPALHDAKFGIGLYRYYADVAPAAFKFLRWLLLLPGGDRRAGLQQMLEARDDGFVIRGEADYQLHLIYLWYEDRSSDALALIRSLQDRYPHNPLFVLNEAEILDVYFHDSQRSAAVLRTLIADAEAERVHQSAIALRRAHALLDAVQPRTAR
jgi:hypothetical protein